MTQRSGPWTPLACRRAQAGAARPARNPEALHFCPITAGELAGKCVAGRVWFHLPGMSPRKLAQQPSPRVAATLNRIAVTFGQDVRAERTRRRWRLGDLAGRAALSRSEVQRIETGQPVSIEACVRVGLALGREPELALRARRPSTSGPRDIDPVHSAMAEIEATHLRGLGHLVRIDEPYQHYQFAGRADLIAFNVDQRALLHIENRTRFPDIQAFAGSWNAKRAYLAAELAGRLGVRGGWQSVTHVVVALWSGEVLHTLRLRTASFEALCPDAPDGFDAWWRGAQARQVVHSSLVVFDPLAGQRRSRRRWVGLNSVATVDPRYRGYADALEHLKRARLA